MSGSNFDWFVGAIALLLPVTAGLLVAQKNPYYALVIRGILGAIAALLYAMFGAADVALTEALVGTMLSITLYAVAVRSSMSLRLGVLATGTDTVNLIQKVNPLLKQVISKYHLRLEPVVFEDTQVLEQALAQKAVHCILRVDGHDQIQILKTRVPRLYEIFKTSALTDVIELQLLELQPAPDVVGQSSPQSLMENHQS
ncbi:hypothetical protein AWQ21_12635 [Picosynechococcus sp. PCC 7003]|uniref:DUF4040 domain-containing protein n=1 Tax=Picosynechococcus sp. PCC 7003 TaxID=374981 RepID=UPI000810EA43|nr:DUF4040 domain-containing protein [Picosynechococcus sp. PCC 7003]ANV85150.1 hypothetical protein AWQ21_12635 [Picosynechococcus sp. PCC 7003]